MNAASPRLGDSFTFLDGVTANWTHAPGEYYAPVEVVTLRKNSCQKLIEGLTPLEQTPKHFTTTTTTNIAQP